MAITCKTGDRIEERVPRCLSGRAVEDLIVGPLSYTFPRFGGGITMCGLLRCSETGSTAEEAALNWTPSSCFSENDCRNINLPVPHTNNDLLPRRTARTKACMLYLEITEFRVEFSAVPHLAYRSGGDKFRSPYGSGASLEFGVIIGVRSIWSGQPLRKERSLLIVRFSAE